jgi:FAD dependent oxidoreductase
MLTCDVLIVGGGAAGIAAAIGATRAGAQTVLVERYGFLGGMGTASLVHTICGLYLLRDEPDAVMAYTGFPSEFASKLLARGGAKGPVRMGRLDVLLHDPAAMAKLADDLIAETSGLRCLLHTELTGASSTNGRWRVSMTSRGQAITIEAATVVDASGDGALAAMAGLPFQQTNAAFVQRPAYVYKLCGVKHEALDESGRLRLAHAIASGVRSQTLPKAALGSGFRAGIHEGECHVTIDLVGDSGDGSCYDPCDVETLSALEQSGRSIATSLTQWLAANAEGFSKAWIAAWPVRAGIRESRRIIGRHVLDVEELLSGIEHEDSIALATWPVELREKATGPRWRFPLENKPGHIPLRALCSAQSATFFMAGRCISASHAAQAAIRVMGTCMATGEAAGIAAALVATDPAMAGTDRWKELAARTRMKRTDIRRPC